MVTQAEIDELAWFHAMDLGDFHSPGRIPPSQPPNFSLFGIYQFLEHIDPTGMDVIDIGTMDGLMAFILKELGASRVAATDLWDRTQFRLARDVLGFDDIEYHTALDIMDMPTRFGTRGFDVMVLAGVLYHLLSPLEYLLHCRQLLRRGGLMLMETCYDETSDEPKLSFNMALDPAPFPEPTTYFLPTLPGLLALLRTASFDPVAVTRLHGGSKRVSVLARASRPSDVRGKTPLQREHDKYVDSPHHFAYGDLFYRLEHDDAPASEVTYAGSVSLDGEVDIFQYRPALPLQPKWS
ncbi:MAG: class I SAM-dependent methyltransferase [Acidimicrobiia bacterium]